MPSRLRFPGKMQLAKRFQMLFFSPANSSICALCWVFQHPPDRPESRSQRDREGRGDRHRRGASEVRCSASCAFECCIYRPLTHPLSFLCSFLDGLVSAPLNKLDLTYNDIGVEGAKAIAAALPR